VYVDEGLAVPDHGPTIHHFANAAHRFSIESNA
jgi:hypothetical protein